MAPFQVIFVRNVRQLYTRGAKKEEFAALDRYFRSPNPQALLIFVADFLRIPTDIRRMDMDDKNRFERLSETLGDHCGMVELARVDEEDAMRWVVATAQEAGDAGRPRRRPRTRRRARRRHDVIASELEKLLLYTLGTRPHHPGRRRNHGARRQAALALRTHRRHQLAQSRARPALLHGLLNSSDGGEDAAIGHLYMLARTFRQMLVIPEKNVRDSAPSGRRCGRASACRPLPPTT